MENRKNYFEKSNKFWECLNQVNINSSPDKIKVVILEFSMSFAEFVEYVWLISF